MKEFGQDQFDAAHAASVIATIHDVPVRFIHYNHLIREKKRSGRPKDIQDVEELENCGITAMMFNSSG